MQCILEHALGVALSDRVECALAVSIFGTANARDIARTIRAFCECKLSVAPEEVHFTDFSVGIVVGARLATGESVVLKFVRADGDAPRMAAARDLQRWLATRRYPCPEVLVAPEPVRDAIGSIERYLTVGRYEDARVPAIRQHMVKALAELVTACEAYERPESLPKFPEDLPIDAVWRPHAPHVNLNASTRLAARIDDVGRCARAMLSRRVGQLVVSHLDWTAEHIRFWEGRPTAVYDWDSVRYGEEAAIVGRIASHFTYSRPLGIEEPPKLDEMRAFVREYEEYRDRQFSATEQEIVSAAATYLVAYIARVEQGQGMTEGPRSQLIAAMKGDLLLSP